MGEREREREKGRGSPGNGIEWKGKWEMLWGGLCVTAEMDVAGWYNPDNLTRLLQHYVY